MKISTKKMLTGILSAAIIISLVFVCANGLNASAAGEEVKGGVNVTKTEYEGDGSLTPKIVTPSEGGAGTTVTVGNKQPDGKYLYIGNHFAYAKLHYDALKEAINGIDLDFVVGNDFNWCGTANVKFKEPNIVVFSMENFKSTKEWGVSVTYTIPTGHSGSSFKHDQTGSSKEMVLATPPAGWDGYIYIYFHSSNIKTTNYKYPLS
ncbi:MAG: hypothetical protein FWG06_04420, partial [Clostridiales bacterium]|nr:hypothetical protein [Clostridiales bacterium]